MPDFASRKAATTSCTLFPMLETMPRPVTTTRRISPSPLGLCWLDQADAKIHRGIDGLAIGFEKPVGDTKIEFPQDHTLEIDDIFDFSDARQHHSGEFHIADTESAPLSGSTEPAEKEAQHLPQGINAEAARHDRNPEEMATEKPKVRLDIEFGDNLAFAKFTAILRYMRDAIEHQHGRQRQLGIAGAEEFAAGTGQKIIEQVMRFA